MTMSDLYRIEKSLPEKDRKRIRVAVFSFDSERDTPSALKEFAKAHGSDLSRWSFLHGSPSSVRKLAAVLGIRYKKDPSGDFEHSNAITLLDSSGTIVDRQIGLGKAPKEIAEKIEGLLRDSSGVKNRTADREPHPDSASASDRK
jgi:protein SCO1/2